MIAVILIMLVIWAAMWGFFKFMYPKPPPHMVPQPGDVITPRECNYCHHHLSEYRGILEPTADPNAPLFFCNLDHQADYHAKKTYQP